MKQIAHWKKMQIGKKYSAKMVYNSVWETEYYYINKWKHYIE